MCLIRREKEKKNQGFLHFILFFYLPAMEKEYALVRMSDNDGKRWDICITDLSAPMWNLANGNVVPDH